VKYRWILMGLAASAAILATGMLLASRESRDVAAVMPSAPADRSAASEHVTVIAATRRTEHNFAQRFTGATFADRFAGAPVWDSSYAPARTDTPVTSYAAAEAPSRALRAAETRSRALRATDAVASRAPGFQLASASADVAVPSQPRAPSIDAEPPAQTTDAEPHERPITIASAVAAFSSEPNSRIAIYDIAAHTVYLPNGDTLEAHSGLGEKLDNPRYIKVRMQGPTPPNVYKMTMREQIFHGVRAIRLTPLDQSKMFGRDGMLAHTYMLRNRGHSNGCVVFSNYPAFLAAFQRGDIDRLVVVEHLDTPPRPQARVASAN
jgi:hypothetical protein